MKKEALKNDKLALRVFLLIFCLVTLICYCYVVAGPILNLVYIYQRADGTSVDTTYGFAWYPVTAFIVTNYLLIVLMFSILADPDNPSRVDMHQILTFITLVFNFVIFVVFLLYRYGFINSAFAGGLPFNDYLWCCRYFIDEPDFCPNTTPCPDVPDLRPSSEFHLIWTFSVVFFAFATAHRVFNLMLRRTGSVTPPWLKSREGEVLAFFANLAYLGFFAYWVGWPLLNTIHLHGFPTLGIPPGPGEFISVRENFPWIALAITSLNVLPPLLLQASLAVRNLTQWVHKVHFWVSIVVSVISGVVLLYFVALLIPFFGYCNFFNSGGSICNSYLWCCVYFADAPNYCNNVTPCPNVGFLLPNSEYVAHIVMELVFVIAAGVSIWLNFRLRTYQLFTDE